MLDRLVGDGVLGKVSADHLRLMQIQTVRLMHAVYKIHKRAPNTREFPAAKCEGWMPIKTSAFNCYDASPRRTYSEDRNSPHRSKQILHRGDEFMFYRHRLKIIRMKLVSGAESRKAEGGNRHQHNIVYNNSLVLDTISENKSSNRSVE